MTIVLLAVLAAAPAHADDSARPYVLVNGHPVASSPSAPASAAAPVRGGERASAVVPAAEQKSAFGSNAVAPRVYAPPAASRSYWGQPPARSRRGAAPRRGARADGSGDQAPPNYSKPGALIRTEGQLPQYSKADGGGTHSVEGGSFVAIDPRQARDVGRAPGIGWAPPDKTPPPNPTSGAGAGGNGATTNPGGGTTIINNDHSNNTNGNQSGGNGNDHGNGGGNGNGNSPTGFDPTF